MKTLSFISLGLACTIVLVCCKPSFNDVVDIDKLGFVLARVALPYQEQIEDPFASEEGVSVCYRLTRDDSLSAFIAQRIQYPYAQIGDSVCLTCNMSFDVDDNGNATTIHSVYINDYTHKLPAAKMKLVTPDLKKQAVSIIRQQKFNKTRYYSSETGKWTVCQEPLKVGFNIAPYPVEKICDKELIVHYLCQMHEINDEYVDIDGRTPLGFVLQQRFKALTSNDEKVDYILHCKQPILRYTAFEGLIENKYPKCASVLARTLADTTTVCMQYGCKSYDVYLPDAMLERIYGSKRVCSVKDSLMLDSIIFYSPKVGNLEYKYNLMDRLAPTPERYNRARELYHKDKYTHAQVLIAKYRNPQAKK